MKNYTVIIPSLNPDEKLLGVVSSLEAAGINDIIIVNDGSKPETVRFFPDPAEHPSCTVLTHSENRGKGAALKTAFSYFIENRPDHEGVITADADGQHCAEDIIKVGDAMLSADPKTGKRYVVLGSRDFSGDDVPPRSRAGNKITTGVFLLLCGMKIPDTQTGLRAIPREYLSDMLNVNGDRYEYETNMLFMLKTAKIPYLPVPISTIYIDDNATSHFRPVRDSIRIYSLILKFVLASISSWIIDTAAFNVFLILFSFTGIYTASISDVIARVISSLFNFTVNKKTVFKNTDKLSRTIARYYILAASILVISAGSMQLVSFLMPNLNKIFVNLIKIIIDILMYLASFRIQQNWVFAPSSRKDK